MPQYLFQSPGLATLARYATPDTLFAFDLDGTLAPIVEEYGAARVPGGLRNALQRLVGLAKVIVLTGRSRKDAQAILGFQPHLVIGNHGAEWPGDSARNWGFVQNCLLWRKQLHHDLFYEPGIEVEYKGESLSIHYRKAPDHERAIELVRESVKRLEPPPRTVGGKFVVNLLPAEVLGKGAALATAMERLGCGRAIYFGDDETDEEVFRLGREDIFGVHVGNDDNTAATWYLNQQSEMLGLLNSIVGMLETYEEVESRRESL